MAKIIESFNYEIENKHGDIVHVSARIEKAGSLYYWYTSHLTKPQDAEKVGIYRPSNAEPSLSEAKSYLESYINMMKRTKVLVLNEYF